MSSEKGQQPERLQLLCSIQRVPGFESRQEVLLGQVARDLHVLRREDGSRASLAVLGPRSKLSVVDEKLPHFRHQEQCVGIIRLTVDRTPDQNRNFSIFTSLFPVRFTFDHLIAELALAFTVAAPGMLEIREMAALVNGEWASDQLDVYSPYLSDWFEASAGHGFPDLSMNPAESLRWIRRVPGYSSGVARDRVGRALGAVAALHQFRDTPDSDETSLLWCLVGLEALHAQGMESAAAEIAAGLSRLFEDPVDPVDLLRPLYRWRNSFLHGRLDFPLPGAFRNYPSNEVDQRRYDRVRARYRELADELEIARLLLILSIHRLAARGITEIPDAPLTLRRV